MTAHSQVIGSIMTAHRLGESLQSLEKTGDLPSGVWPGRGGDWAENPGQFQKDHNGGSINPVHRTAIARRLSPYHAHN